MKAFFQTDDRWTGLIVRVMLALVIFPHGAQKLLGWFGGNGFEGTMGFFTQQMGMPWIVAFLVIIGESVGALALALGLFTRFSAASLGVIMLGAITIVHWPHGFFMNWFGQQAGEGFEFHLLVIGMALALVAEGGGKWSVDRAIAGFITSETSERHHVPSHVSHSAI
ncbi:MAG: DoxX family protein [Nitrospirales bacterium]|nr:DoxX family protein [Nitrospira sp.]MDR4499932.1 DoxX family protein [Nitrospirales bacterium]